MSKWHHKSIGMEQHSVIEEASVLTRVHEYKYWIYNSLQWTTLSRYIEEREMLRNWNKSV